MAGRNYIMQANANGKGGASLPQPASNLDAVIVLIDELVAAIEDENENLARGIPASLSASIARKNELADCFEQWVALVKERRLQIPPDDRQLRNRLLQRTTQLRERMAENIDRLQAAMEASRRRVEAVMSAIRQHAAADSPYGANGRVAAPRAVNGGMSRRI
jgi:hypothetical protein